MSLDQLPSQDEVNAANTSRAASRRAFNLLFLGSLGIVAIVLIGHFDPFGITESNDEITYASNAENKICLAKGDDPKYQALAQDFEKTIRGFASRKRPAVIPNVQVQGPSGKIDFRSLRGKVLLVNYWATWCPPCLMEMPDLDRLERAQGGGNFEVVAVNIDNTGEPKAAEFYQKVGINSLQLYLDPSSSSFSTFRANGFLGRGLPQSLVVDKDGCEIGRLLGPEHWDKKAIQDLFKRLRDIDTVYY